MKRLSERKKRWIERTASNDRSYKLYLYNRFFIFLLLVLLQIIISVQLTYSIVYSSSKWSVLLQELMWMAELVFVLYLINKSERPSEKLSWILLILTLPIVGVPGYLLYGEGRQSRRMQRLTRKAKKSNLAQRKQVQGELPIFTPQNRSDSICGFLQSYAE